MYLHSFNTNVLFADVHRRRSPKIEIEHVANTETVIGTNYWKTLKNGMKNQKNKRRCKNALKIKNRSGGITTRKYSPIYILVKNSPIFPPSNSKFCPTAGSKTTYELQRTVKTYTRSFMFFLRTSRERSQQIFFPFLCFDLHWEKFVCAKPNQRYLNML